MVWVLLSPLKGKKLGSWCQHVVRSDSFSFDGDNSEVLGLSRKKWRGPLCVEIWKSNIPFGEEITGSYHLLSLSDCFLSPFPWLLLPQNCPLILQNGRLCPLLWDVKMPGAHWHWRQRRVLWESSAHPCVEMIHNNWSGGVGLAQARTLWGFWLHLFGVDYHISCPGDRHEIHTVDLIWFLRNGPMSSLVLTAQLDGPGIQALIL